MIGKEIGALFGAEVERSRGQSGAKGAVIGALATSLVRRMGPLGLLIGGAYVVKRAIDRRRDTAGDGGSTPTG